MSPQPFTTPQHPHSYQEFNDSVEDNKVCSSTQISKKSKNRKDMNFFKSKGVNYEWQKSETKSQWKFSDIPSPYNPNWNRWVLKTHFDVNLDTIKGRLNTPLWKIRRLKTARQYPNLERGGSDYGDTLYRSNLIENQPSPLEKQLLRSKQSFKRDKNNRQGVYHKTLKQNNQTGLSSTYHYHYEIQVLILLLLLFGS